MELDIKHRSRPISTTGIWGNPVDIMGQTAMKEFLIKNRIIFDLDSGRVSPGDYSICALGLSEAREGTLQDTAWAETIMTPNDSTVVGLKF